MTTVSAFVLLTIISMSKEIRQNTVSNVSTSCLLQKLDSILKNRRRFGSGCAYARVDLNFSLTVKKKRPFCRNNQEIPMDDFGKL